MRALEASPFRVDGLVDQLVLPGSLVQLVLVLGVGRGDVENLGLIFHQKFQVLHLLVPLGITILGAVDHPEDVSGLLRVDALWAFG